MAKKKTRKKKKPYKPKEKPTAFVVETALTVINDDKNEREGTRAANAVLAKDTIEYQTQVKRIFEYIREGLQPGEIQATLLIEDNELSPKQFQERLADAYKLAELAIYKDREYTFQLHMERYEKLWNECIKLQHDNGVPLDPWKDKGFMNQRLIEALQQLQAKEKLIGLHDKSMILEVSQTSATVIEAESHRGNNLPGYDLDKMKLEDQIELLTLIREARTVPIEGIQRVVIKKTVIEIKEGERSEYQQVTNIDDVHKVKTHDIEFEEMPNDVVGQFQQIPDKVEEEEEVIGPMIEDLTEGKLEEKRNAEDVVKAIQETALDQLRQKLKKKKLGS